MNSKKNINHAIIFIVDDVRAQDFFTLIEKNKLPNIKKLVNEGTYCDNCITSYPSITYPCYSNIVLGTYSDYFLKIGSGIPMYHFVDRNPSQELKKRFPKIINCGKNGLPKLNKLIGTNCKTIFEQAGEGNFLSSLNLISRGSLQVSPNLFTTEVIIKNVIESFTNPRKFFENNEPPKISIAYLPLTDDIYHKKGSSHPDYINELVELDKNIGNLTENLRKISLLENTAIGIISDHGNYVAKKTYDLEPYFNELGLMQYNPRKGIGDFDATMGSVGFFNFRGSTWHEHPNLKQLESFKPSTIGKKEINLLEELWRIPDVEYMYYKDDDCSPEKGIIHIRKRINDSDKFLDGLIEYQGFGIKQKTRYEFEDEEIFGYSKDEWASKILDGRFHDINEWLTHTHSIDFPLIIDQIPRYFKNPRSCDIIISTIGKCCFNYEHGKTVSDHRFSHDIGLKRSMTVPFILSGSPSIPRKKISFCKTTDMVPTILNLLGMKAHESVVGKSIFKYN